MITAISFFMVKELAVWAMIGLVAAALWVVPLIDFLYRFQFTIKHIEMPSKINAEWMKIHGKDSGTPSLGGILIWLTIPFLLLIGFWEVPLMKAVSFIFLLVGAYGFLDGLSDVLTKNNVKFREFQNKFEWRVGKFIIAMAINVIVALIIVKIAGIQQIDVFGFNLVLNSLVGILILTLASTFFTYATEIIDGIDGLSSGMFLITIVGFTLLMLAFPASYFTSGESTAAVIAGVMMGVLMVYLYFNIPPARIYMGAPGAMPMGPVFLLLGLYGNVLPALIVLMLPYFVDLATSFIQLWSIRFFGKKVFKIAPIHHHFEAIGWPGTKVVMRFWLFNVGIILLAVLAQVYFG